MYKPNTTVGNINFQMVFKTTEMGDSTQEEDEEREVLFLNPVDLHCREFSAGVGDSRGN